MFHTSSVMTLPSMTSASMSNQSAASATHPAVSTTIANALPITQSITPTQMTPTTHTNITPPHPLLTESHASTIGPPSPWSQLSQPMPLQSDHTITHHQPSVQHPLIPSTVTLLTPYQHFHRVEPKIEMLSLQFLETSTTQPQQPQQGGWCEILIPFHQVSEQFFSYGLQVDESLTILPELDSAVIRSVPNQPVTLVILCKRKDAIVPSSGPQQILLTTPTPSALSIGQAAPISQPSQPQPTFMANNSGGGGMPPLQQQQPTGLTAEMLHHQQLHAEVLHMQQVQLQLKTQLAQQQAEIERRSIMNQQQLHLYSNQQQPAANMNQNLSPYSTMTTAYMPSVPPMQPQPITHPLSLQPNPPMMSMQPVYPSQPQQQQQMVYLQPPPTTNPFAPHYTMNPSQPSYNNFQSNSNLSPMSMVQQQPPPMQQPIYANSPMHPLPQLSPQQYQFMPPPSQPTHVPALLPLSSQPPNHQQEKFSHSQPHPSQMIVSDDPEKGLKGTSCHQCKNTKPLSKLAFCSHSFMKRTRPEKRCCRKKFCDSCLKKFYRQGLPLKPDQWICPSCRHECVCAACVRVVMANSKRGRWNGSEESEEAVSHGIKPGRMLIPPGIDGVASDESEGDEEMMESAEDAHVSNGHAADPNSAPGTRTLLEAAADAIVSAASPARATPSTRITSAPLLSSSTAVSTASAMVSLSASSSPLVHAPSSLPRRPAVVMRRTASGETLTPLNYRRQMAMASQSATDESSVKLESSSQESEMTVSPASSTYSLSTPTPSSGLRSLSIQSQSSGATTPTSQLFDPIFALRSHGGSSGPVFTSAFSKAPSPSLTRRALDNIRAHPYSPLSTLPSSLRLTPISTASSNRSSSMSIASEDINHHLTVGMGTIGALSTSAPSQTRSLTQPPLARSYSQSQSDDGHLLGLSVTNSASTTPRSSTTSSLGTSTPSTSISTVSSTRSSLSTFTHPLFPVTPLSPENIRAVAPATTPPSNDTTMVSMSTSDDLPITKESRDSSHELAVIPPAILNP